MLIGSLIVAFVSAVIVIVVIWAPLQEQITASQDSAREQMSHRLDEMFVFIPVEYLGTVRTGCTIIFGITGFLIGFKSALREVRLIFSPNTVLSVFVGGKRVPETVVRSVAGFFILYVTIWALGALLQSLGGPDLVTTATASAATIGNIGPGLMAVGPTGNFAFFSAPDKLLMVVLMWIGRLEVYAIAALFMRAFWRP